MGVKAGHFDLVRNLKTDVVSDAGASFDDLYRQHSTYVYNTCLGMLGNADDARDALQDTFVQLYKSLAEIRDHKVLRTWLYRVAVNKCISILRRRPKWQTAETADSCAQMTSADPLLEQHVRQTILKLKPHYRAVLVLRYFQDLSYAEIAASLDCSLDQARSWLHRARKAFRLAYDEGDGDDEV